MGQYNFIGRPQGLGKIGKVSYEEAWKGFERSLTTCEIPCTSIKRYPVVARWRNDVEYVAAGIYCFQPYCVTGEMDAPANPLICPQFCVRFNDLDNIGITGRHYSGFIMIGIQVFNLPSKWIFFNEEVIDFNLRWLTETLMIDKDEITFTEDVWAGGGNLGPSIEYFISGLELGNMVFMQFKSFPDGHLEDLPVKVIDVGIGLERIPWLINGTPTSYVDVFGDAFVWLRDTLKVEVNSDIWAKFGPYSSQLNVDDVDDIDAMWETIATRLGMSPVEVRSAIEETRDLYIILDHSRTVMMVIEDGSLPSNVGGGANVRNILRRIFAIMHKNGWWEKIGLKGLLELFEKHKECLGRLYGKFPEYKSFEKIIGIEYQRWLSTDEEQKKKLEKLLKKNKGVLSIDDWIIAVTSWGIPADRIAQIAKQEVPNNLYTEISDREERVTKKPEVVLYDTTHLPETRNLYYQDHKMLNFHAQVLEVMKNKTTGKNDIIILTQSAFYPNSGGQIHDVGTMRISEKILSIYKIEKVGKCVLHFVSPEIVEDIRGAEASCEIEKERREQLTWHHTATHIIYASAREVLGPHVWQHGAKKTPQQAHLDITHYNSLTKTEEMLIENRANTIIRENRPIHKYFLDKTTAEKKFGFHLYQGGIVPGNVLRIVDIEGIDTEACCGTHLDSTGEIGFIKLIKSQRISDGIVRMTFVAGVRGLQELDLQTDIINQLCQLWKIEQVKILPTAQRFFSDYKKVSQKAKTQEAQILRLQVQTVLTDPQMKCVVVRSDHPDPTLYFSHLNMFAGDIKQSEKCIAMLGDTFLIGISANPQLINLPKITQLLLKYNEKARVVTKNKVVYQDKEKKVYIYIYILCRDQRK